MQRVEIRVRRQIDEQWSEWFEGLTVTPTDEGDTLLTDVVVDQAAGHDRRGHSCLRGGCEVSFGLAGEIRAQLT